MFGEKQNYFKNGRIDQAALVSFIKDIKKNTSLSDEDAAIIAASKVRRVFSGRKIFFSGRKYFELYLSVSQARKVACLCLYLCYKRILIQHFS